MVGTNSLTRIKADNVQIGNKFILPVDQDLMKATETRIEQLIAAARAKHQKIIQQAEIDAQDLLKKAEIDARELLIKAETDANELIQKTKAESEQMINEANASVDAIKDAAYKEGYDAGYKQGYDDITKELENRVYAVDTFAQSNFDIKHNIISSAEKDILELTMAICDKICQKSFEKDKKILEDLTISAIKELKDKEQITIIINPELAETLYSISDKLREKIPKLGSIKVLEDANISADGSIVESVLSRVDSRITTQINEITEKLMNEYEASTEEFSTENLVAETKTDDQKLVEESKISTETEPEVTTAKPILEFKRVEITELKNDDTDLQ